MSALAEIFVASVPIPGGHLDMIAPPAAAPLGGGTDIDREAYEAAIANKIGRLFEHEGPGPHKGTGTPQAIHGKKKKAKKARWAKDPNAPPPQIAGGLPPKKTIKAYKLFATKKSRPGELFPLFIDKATATPLGEWLPAVFFKRGVHRPPGDFADRPGWHAGDLPMAPHLRGRDDFIGDGRVWAEVEMPADVDWQPEADKHKKKNAQYGELKAKLPEGGYYRFKTNPNQKEAWIIAGGIRVLRVLSDEEVATILTDAGFAEDAKYERHDVRWGSKQQVAEHQGPGDHPGTGTPQSIHGGKRRSSAWVMKADPATVAAKGSSTMIDSTTGKPRVSLRDAARQVLELTSDEGGRVLNDAKDADINVMADAMAEEVAEAAARDGNAIGWYDKTVKKMWDVLYEVDPDFKNSHEARAVFTAVAAIYSNGQSIDVNFKGSLKQWRHFKEHGEFDLTEKFGGKNGPAMRKSLETLQAMIKKSSVEEVAEFLETEMTVGEINSFGLDVMRLDRDEMLDEKGKRLGPTRAKRAGYNSLELDVTGESVTHTVRGSMAFGPKIGSFYANLMGYHDSVTMDRWFMRSYSRIRGNLLTPKAGALKKQTDRLIGAIKGAKEGALRGYDRDALVKQGEAFRDTGDYDAAPDFFDFANDEYDAYSAANFGTEDRSLKTELAKSAQRIIENSTGLRDHPGNSKERARAREVVRRAQASLANNHGIVLTNADFQAVLWYHEKDLYRQVGYNTQRAVKTDYYEAARRLWDSERLDRANRTLRANVADADATFALKDPPKARKPRKKGKK